MREAERPPTDAELVDLVLGRLPPARREALRRQAATDARLARRLGAVGHHLRRYDAWTSPPPPPFSTLSEARPSRRPEIPRWRTRAAGIAAGLAALVLLAIGLGLLVPRPTSAPTALTARALAGTTIVREGRRIPGGEFVGGGIEGGTLRVGDVVRASAPAAIEIGDRVALVLDGGSALRYLGPGEVRLDAGRVHAEVRGPYPFSVVTAQGAVEVLGTVFEVRLVEKGRLEVTVFEGRVRVGDLLLDAGSRLGPRGVEVHGRRPGRWFRTPRLRVEARSGGRLADGLDLVLVLEPPGALPVRVGGPPDVRRALWIEVRDPAGGVHDLTPSLPGPPFGLVSGDHRVLRPGEALRQRVRLAAPGRLPGPYRCRAMYRPEHEAPVISAGVEVELPE